MMNVEHPRLILGREDMLFYPVLDDALMEEVSRIRQHWVGEFEPRHGEDLGGVCHLISAVVAIETGLGIEGGVFHLDEPRNGLTVSSHFWCKDGLGRIIDLTASQFNGHVEENLPNGVLVVDPQTPLYKRYEKGQIVFGKSETLQYWAVEMEQTSQK